MSGYDFDNQGKPLDSDGVTTGKKAKKKKHATPGKAAGTDNYGEGGPDHGAPVPGKAAGTDQLPAGPNGANGQNAQGQDAKAQQKHDGGTKPSLTEGPKAGGGAEDKAGPKKANGKPAKAPQKTDTPAQPDAKAVSGKEAKQPVASQAGHDIAAAPAKNDTPLLGKPVFEPQLSVVADVAPPPPVVVAPPEGGKVDASYESLKTEVAALNSLIKANRDEILALSKSFQQQVAGTLDAHAAAIDTKVTAGSKRVVDAYDGIGKALTDANTKAQGELKKREESIPQVIKAARDKKAAELAAITTKTKETTKQNVTSPTKVAAAHKVGMAFVQDVEKKRGELKEKIDGLAGPTSPLGAELNPKKKEWSVERQKGEAARELGKQALAADKQLAILTKSAKQLHAAVDTSMGDFSKRYGESGMTLINEVLAAEDAELQPALDIRKKEQDKSLDEAAKGATETLKSQVASTRTNLDKTTKDAHAKVAEERKPAEEGATRAGQKLAENIKFGAKEIGNQIAKKAAADAKAYDQGFELLRKLASSNKLTPSTKQQLDALKEQLTKAHEENKKAPEQLATTGIAEMKSQKEQEYDKAISDYESGANKTKTDLLAKVDGATGELGKSFDSIGTSFDEVVGQQTKKLQATLGEYTQKTNALPDTFKAQLTAKLEIIGGDLQSQIDKALVQDNLKEGLRKAADPDIKAGIKQGPKDAQALWKAMDGVGTDENAIFAVLRNASPGMVVFIEGCYNDHYDNHGTARYPSPLRADLDDELSGSEWDIAFAYLNHQREKAIKLELDNSQGYFNDEEERIEQVLRAASDDEIKSIMASPDGKAIVEDVKDSLSSCDLHVVEALTDVNNLADRKIKADSIRLYDAMHGGTGIGTEEAKVKAILENCTDDAERAKLRAYYNSYYAKQEVPWAKLTDDQAQAKNADGEDFLTASLESEFSSGERTYVRALAKEKRDKEEVAMAKLIDAAAGGGTDEEKMFESLDDEEHKRKFLLAKTDEERAALLNEREARLNQKLAGLESKALGFGGDTVHDIIKGESGYLPVTYQELLDLTWTTNQNPNYKRPNPGQKIDAALARRLAKQNLEAMVAQRKLAAGFAEPELMLMWACHGDGTNEDWCKKALSNGGEPLSQGEVKRIKDKFKEVWGGHEKLAPDENELVTKQEPKTGLLASELDGKEWFDVRVLLMGRPETPEQIGYVDNVRYAFVTSGSIGQGGGEVSPWSRARADMDHSHQKLQKAVKDAEGKKLSDFDDKDGIDDNRLEVLAQYSEQSSEAFLEAVQSFADTLITIIELIGAALITVVSMGAGSPFLIAFCANLVLSGVTIAMRKDMVGDAIGTDQVLIDSAKAVVMAAVTAAPQAKVVQSYTKAIGNKIAGKLVVGFGEAAEKGGMRLVGTSLEITEKGAQRIASIATASATGVGSMALSETAGFLMDEKTYDMKFGEAIWGENSLGARLAKGLPQALVRSAVNDYISDVVGISNLRHRGNISGVTKHALYSALAEMGGETAGFFVYLDNYADAGAFWEQLLRTNVRAGISGTLNGIAMHRARAKKLGRDFINAHLDNDAGAIAQTRKDLDDALGYMAPEEKLRLAEFIAKEKPELIPHLPDEFKALAQKAAGAKNTTTTTDTTSTTTSDSSAGDNDQLPKVQKKPTTEQSEDEKRKAVTDQEVKPADDDTSTTKKQTAGEDKPSPKTRDDHEKQTEKPDAETDEAARERRSQALKPRSKDAKVEDWANPADRKGVPETVPLTRQELRDLVTEKYHATLEKYLKKAKTGTDPNEPSPFDAIIADLQKEAPGSIDKKKAEEYLARWGAAAKEVAAKTGHDEAELRVVYNVVEQDDFKNWFKQIEHLPKEQQAMMAHMWREELKLYVRDMMSNEKSKEVLYLRDLAMSGDRRGPKFDALVAGKLKKNPGDIDAAYDGVMGSSRESNKAVNKTITNSADGLDEAMAAKIRGESGTFTGQKQFDSMGRELVAGPDGRLVPKEQPETKVVDDDEQKPKVVDKDEDAKKQKAQQEEEEKKRAKQSAEEEEAKKQKHGASSDTTGDDGKYTPSKQQLDQGHSGVEVHSHFMGNVEAENIKSVVGGAKSANKDGMVSEWEPVLREIARLDLQNKEGFRHQRNAETGDIEKRGKTGDAIDLVEKARTEIAKLKNEKTRAENGTGRFAEMSPEQRRAHADELVRKIDDVARNAVKKALAASDETDFNSSYEVRDELVKKFYGAEQRKEVLPSGHVSAIDLDPNKRTTLMDHFEGRPEVQKRIQRASELQDLAKKGTITADQEGELAGLKKNIEEQFSYDHYAKETIRRLAEDNIQYTEQSNSAKKLAQRFDPEQFDVLRKQLIAEQEKILASGKVSPDERAAAEKKLAQLQNLHVAQLTMVNTSNFGERQFGDEFPENKRSSLKDFKEKEVAAVVKQVKDRKDTAGVDIAGAEHFRFDEGGQARMRILYDALAEVGTPDQPVVLRPHVGEGANDIQAGKQGHRDQNRRTTDDGELTHYERARHNIDKMLEVFDDIANSNGGQLPKSVIVRFGHVTHATPEQAARMAKLGIIAEVNLSSNVETGAHDQNPGGKPRAPQRDNEPKPAERLEDHSLPSLIKEGAPVILSTDAHEVMNTNLSREYEKAKTIIEEIRSNQRPVRVSVAEAKERGYEIVQGPPPHGLAHYHQLTDVEKKRFDHAYEKLYADANKYFQGRPKQDGDGSTTPKSPDGGSGPSSTDAPDVRATKKKQLSRAKKEQQIDDLVAQLSSNNVYQRTRAQSDLENLMKDPEFAEMAKLKGAFITAKKHQDGVGPDTKLLSDNIGGLLANADQARVGKNPVLQAKRDQFERELALEILKEGPVRKQVDDELARMCAKARDYILKTRASEAEQEAALAGLGTDKNKGYGGGLHDKDKSQRQNADTILEVLQSGNIRERMLALGEFMNLVGKDALTPEGKQRLQKMAEHGGNAEGSYSAADAQRMLERVAQYEQEEKKADKRSVKGLFSPNAEEKASGGAHHDYADAKAQDMDTKLPVLLHDKVQEFLGRETSGDANKLAKKGEGSALARTDITVREAIAKGLQLSDREIAAAGGLDAPLNWVVGQRANMVDPTAPFIADAKNESMPLKAGVSGTTYRWMQLVTILDADPNLGRLAAIAALQAADAHSFHEIAFAAKGFGVDYDSSTPYANVGIDEAILRQIARKLGMTLEELNGNTAEPEDKYKST